MTARSSIGDRVRIARKAAGLTQSELANRVGVQTQTVSQYETGVIKDILLSTAAKIADATGVRVRWLADGEEPMRDPDQDGSEEEAA